MKLKFQLPSQSTKLHWDLLRNLQNDHYYTRQRKQSTNEKTISTKAEGQTTAEEFVDPLHEFGVECILHHVGEGDNVLYAVRWYGYTLLGDTVEPPEHIPELFTTPYWIGMKNLT